MNASNVDITRLFKDFNKPIYNYVFFRVNGSKEEAEDIASEVFLRAAKYRDSYNSDLGTEKTWLFGITRNILKDYYSAKSKQNTISLNEVEEGLLQDDKQIDIIDKKILVEYVIIAINKLKKTEKDLIILKFIVGLKIKEICELEGKEESAIKVSIHRAKQKLLNLLNER